MSNYILPRLKVYQEFEPVLTGATLPLHACIVAPQYGLHRYSEEDEQALLGSYNPAVNNVFAAYPDKTAGSVIDTSWNKIYFKDAVLQYYQFSTTGLTANDGNKVRSSTLVFKEGNGSSRAAVFGTRDVAVGDYAKVQWGSSTVETTIAALIPEEVAATTGALAAATGNQAATTLTQTSSAVSITPTAVTLTGVSATGYDGLADGHPSEVYVCTVTTAGLLGSAKVSIASQSGTDDVAEQLLSVSAASTPCGTRGATFTLTDTFVAESSSSSSQSSSSSSSETESVSYSSSSSSLNSQSSESSEVGGRELKVGDTWTATVAQTYSLPAPVASGTYTGSTDTTYVVRIISGGVVDTDTVIFDVYTTTGVDNAPSLATTANGAYNVGNYGVDVTLNAAEQYVTGDQFTIAVTASGYGAYQTLAFAENLTGATTADTFTITLGLEDDIQLANDKWTSTSTSITVYASAQYRGSYLGTAADFYILEGEMYVEYRELLVTNATGLGAVSQLSEVEATLGPAVTANPLSLMVYKAVLNAGGVDVYYVALSADSLAGYVAALDVASDSENPYSIVPFSTAANVKAAVKAHCLAMSLPEFGLWRICWLAADVDRTQARYTALASGNDILATVADAGGGLYTAVTATGGLFITNGTVPGDTFRINYSVDPYGTESYDEYVIDAVTSEETLTLLTGPSAPISVAIKSEVWYTATLNQYAAAIAADATALNHRRVRDVWSEPISDTNNATMPLSVLAAGLAGLRSGSAPHQPLTNVEVAGFTPTQTYGFSTTQLNTMAGAGIWICTSNLTGDYFTRHQVTTDNDDINMREDTITTNLDHISRDFRTSLADLYGRGNVSKQMIELIRSRVNSRASAISARNYPDTLGPQLQDIEITRLAADPVLRDHVDVVIEPVLPYPLNNLNVYIRVS